MIRVKASYLHLARCRGLSAAALKRMLSCSTESAESCDTFSLLVGTNNFLLSHSVVFSKIYLYIIFVIDDD